MLKVSLGLLKQTCDTRVIHFNYTLEHAALAWTKKKRSLRNEKLKANRASETEEQGKEMLRIRRETKKTEKHEKQRLATLKRLKRGDDSELERNLRLEKVVASKQLRLAEQDWRMMQLPNGSGWPWRWMKKENQDCRRC